MRDIVRQAKSYLRANAAESGADVLIEEMVKDIAALEAALKPFAEMPGCWEMHEDDVIYKNAGVALTAGDFRRARAIAVEQNMSPKEG